MPDLRHDQDGIEICQGPDPDPRPPDFPVPAGACDTHAHVIGPPDRYPYVATRSYTAPPASTEAYIHMLDTLGMARGVLVQVSIHGTDNSRMVETLRRYPQRLRGVAVVAPDITDEALAELDAAGVRGIRFNMLYGGGVGLGALEELARRIAQFGWHVQFLLDARELPTLAGRIERLPVPFVIDHMGHMETATGLDHPGFRTLLAMIGNTNCWVKLSGAPRLSSAGYPYRDTIPMAHALVKAAPDRLVWGSDWPHVTTAGQMPNDGELLDLFGDWVPDPVQREAILVHNPARLYGFP